jgi:excisionase family DNA binding protein
MGTRRAKMSRYIWEPNRKYERRKVMPGTQTLEDENDLLTVHEVAKKVRVDDTTVRRWIKNGALDAVGLPHVGKRCAYRVKRSVIEALLNAPVSSYND